MKVPTIGLKRGLLVFIFFGKFAHCFGLWGNGPGDIARVGACPAADRGGLAKLMKQVGKIKESRRFSFGIQTLLR